jgi:hypothetical protein
MTDTSIQRRLAEATADAAHWKQQAANLQDIVDAQYDTDQIPVLRRLIMQRREIRTAWASAARYQRLWRAEVNRLGHDGNKTAGEVIENALTALRDTSLRSTQRVKRALQILDREERP